MHKLWFALKKKDELLPQLRGNDGAKLMELHPLRSDTLIDQRPLHLKNCCGKEPVVHRFTSVKAYGIECRVNGHIHNTGLWDSLEKAVEAWNRGMDQ